MAAMLSFKDVFMTSSQKEVDSAGSKNDHLTNVDKCCHSMTPDGLFFLVKIYDWEKKLRRRHLGGKKKRRKLKAKVEEYLSMCVRKFSFYITISASMFVWSLIDT